MDNSAPSTSRQRIPARRSSSPRRNPFGRSIPRSIPSNAKKEGFHSPREFTDAAQFATPKSFHSSVLFSRPTTPMEGYLGETEFSRRISEHLVEFPRNTPDSLASASHSLLGGDTTRDIYQWSEKRNHLPFKRRNSNPELYSNTDQETVYASDLRQPGVFRRYFIQSKASEKGHKPPNFITSNFIDFLAIYGVYGGDVYPSDDEFYYDAEEFDEEADYSQQETAPLMPPQLRKQGSLSSIHGTSESKVFFLLTKAFVGTGVLFLPKGFSNGGLGFSIILLLVIGWLTLYCMLLLVETSRELGGSFGDLGEKLYGPKVKQLILWSIAVSQMGFCCAYYIFVAQNLRDITMTVSGCKLILADWVFILFQAVVYVPLSWIRKIKHFSMTSLIADVFILIGLSYIFYFNSVKLSTEGISKDIIWFNFQSFPLFIGTSLFAFEGICLILPIAESMKEPEKFGKVLTLCIITIGSIFILIGASGYLAFGEKVATIVFLNLPNNSTVTTIQFFYAVAILLSFPLTVYPAIRITEHKVFGVVTGRVSALVKWQKNFFRTCMIAFLSGVAVLGSSNLDKFVALVGCFACIPLSFIYPALFHYHIAKNSLQKMFDVSIILFGLVAMVYTTFVTLRQWLVDAPDTPISRCK